MNAVIFLYLLLLFKNMNQFPIITEITPDVLHGAMDQHAKNISMAFADWLNETNWGEKQTWGRHNPPSYPTTEQLYEIFKKEIQNP